MAKFKFDTKDNFPVTNDVFKGLQDEVEALKNALLTNVIMYEGGFYWLKKPTSLSDGFIGLISLNQLTIYRIEKNNYLNSDDLSFQTNNADVQSQGGGTISNFKNDHYLAKKKSGQVKDLAYSDIKDLGKKNKGGIIKYTHTDSQAQNNVTGDTANLQKSTTGVVDFTWNKAENVLFQVLPNELSNIIFLHKILKVSNNQYKISTYNIGYVLTDISFTLIYNNY